MDGFKFKGMAGKPEAQSSAPVRAMGDLTVQVHREGVKRKMSDEDSPLSPPPKHAKIADSITPEPVPEADAQGMQARTSMQAVWDQAHNSRCAARLNGLNAELTAAPSQSQRDDIKGRIERLQRALKETGSDLDVMLLD